MLMQDAGSSLAEQKSFNMNGMRSFITGSPLCQPDVTLYKSTQQPKSQQENGQIIQKPQQTKMSFRKEIYRTHEIQSDDHNCGPYEISIAYTFACYMLY
mmetsp:Transcript_16448/g.23041  ORF Transcript_16448/g.23041 Transcript_16448/m.23041 type:complete len:99 (-) Transcript_16448:383-679(-)